MGFTKHLVNGIVSTVISVAITALQADGVAVSLRPRCAPAATPLRPCRDPTATPPRCSGTATAAAAVPTSRAVRRRPC